MDHLKFQNALDRITASELAEFLDGDRKPTKLTQSQAVITALVERLQNAEARLATISAAAAEKVGIVEKVTIESLEKTGNETVDNINALAAHAKNMANAARGQGIEPYGLTLSEDIRESYEDEWRGITDPQARANAYERARARGPFGGAR